MNRYDVVYDFQDVGIRHFSHVVCETCFGVRSVMINRSGWGGLYYAVRGEILGLA